MLLFVVVGLAKNNRILVKAGMSLPPPPKGAGIAQWLERRTRD